MLTQTFTTVDLLPTDDDERDQIIARATARESTAEPGRYYVDLPANVTIYGDKPLLHEILTRALAALHADDEPAADPELVEGDVVALRISPNLREVIEMGDVDDVTAETRAMHVFKAIRDALPRSAA